MKVYITKYALTHGIIATEAVRDPHDHTIVHIKRGAGMRQLSQNDWYTSKKAAKARAEEMRVLKLMSLTRQAERVGDLKF